jgi:hypothetical protein
MKAVLSIITCATTVNLALKKLFIDIYYLGGSEVLRLQHGFGDQRKIFILIFIYR